MTQAARPLPRARAVNQPGRWAGGRKGRSPRRDRAELTELTWSGERVMIGSQGTERMPLRRYDDSQRSGRLAVTQPERPLSPHDDKYLPHNQLTDRPVRDLAHAVAFAPLVAFRSTGSVDRTASAAPLPPARAIPDPRRRLTSCKAHLQRRRLIRLAASPPAAAVGVVTRIPTYKEVE